MVRLLVADENIEQIFHYYQFLTNDKELSIENAKDGLTALNKYLKLRPNILILDSNFSDIHYTEIIDRISSIPEEKKMSNTILTINTSEEQLRLKNASKIYKILQKPLKTNELLETINTLKCEFNIPDLTIHELDSLLLRLNFNIHSNGTRYMKSAIFQCYYYPNTLNSLDNIFNVVAFEHNISTEQVREGLRSSLTPLNNSMPFYSSTSLFELFDDKRNITPKYFLEVFVTYLHILKNKL